MKLKTIFLLCFLSIVPTVYSTNLDIQLMLMNTSYNAITMNDNINVSIWTQAGINLYSAKQSVMFHSGVGYITLPNANLDYDEIYIFNITGDTIGSLGGFNYSSVPLAYRSEISNALSSSAIKAINDSIGNWSQWLKSNPNVDKDSTDDLDISKLDNNTIVRSHNISWLNNWYSGIGYYTYTNFTAKYATIGYYTNSNASSLISGYSNITYANNLTMYQTRADTATNLSNYLQNNSDVSISKLNVTIIRATSDINTSGNLAVEGYLMGQPLLGMLGSGIIEVQSSNKLTEVNLTCSGLTCSYPQFRVRLVSGNSATNAKYCNISSGSTVVTDNQQTVLYIDSNCVVQSGEISNFFNEVLTDGGLWDFGNVVCYSGNCELVNGISLEQRRMMKQRVLNFNNNHLKVVSGFSKAQDTHPKINLSEGKYIYLMDIVTVGAKTASDKIEIIAHNGTSTKWRTFDNSGLNITWCDNSTDINLCTNTNKYRRVFIFMVGYNDTTDTSEVHQLLPLESVSYSSLSSCLDTTTNPLVYTLPSFYSYSAVPLWAYCTQASSSLWDGGWIDLRTVKTSTSSSLGSIDTSIFLTTDGTRSLTAHWNAGYNIQSPYFIGKFNGTWNESGSYQLIAGAYAPANFTANYDARTDRFGNSNFSALYAGMGYYTLTNFTANYGTMGYYTNTNWSAQLTASNIGNWTKDKPSYQTMTDTATNLSNYQIKLANSSNITCVGNTCWYNGTVGAGITYTGGQNISVSGTTLSLNITCETITGSSTLCDGNDATGAGSTPPFTDIDNVFIDNITGTLTFNATYNNLTINAIVSSNLTNYATITYANNVNVSARAYAETYANNVNTSLISYANNVNASARAYTVSANTSMKSYVDANTLTLTSLENSSIVRIYNGSWITSSVGNWTNDKGSYPLATSLPNLSYANVVSGVGNWTKDKPSYQTMADTATNLSGYATSTYVNNLNTSLISYANNVNASARAYAETYANNVNASLISYANNVNASARAYAESYANNVNVSARAYTDTRISNVNTSANLRLLGFNITTELKDYFDTLYTMASGLFQNSNWTSQLTASNIGNWTLDKPSYQTKADTATNLSGYATSIYVNNLNTSLISYANNVNASARAYTESANTSMKSYVDANTITLTSLENSSIVRIYNGSWITSSVGNWTKDSVNYPVTTSLPNLTYANIVSGVGNWTLDKPSYQTKADTATNLSNLILNDSNATLQKLNVTLNLSIGGCNIWWNGSALCQCNC